jgi:hypothetical protein
MKWMIPALIIIIGFAFCTGCMSNQESIITNDTVSVTPVVVTPMHTLAPEPEPILNVAVTVTETPMRIVTRVPTPMPTEEEWVPDWTPEPEIIPLAETDTTKINFTQFVSNDFMAKYPVTWLVMNETFTLPDTTLYGQDIWKKEGRMITFVSEDGKTRMKVSVRDFLNPGPNRYTFTPTIDSARRSVALLFSNASSETSVYNYQYKKNDQHVFTSSYDVIFTQSSEYWPYTYTEETWTTYNHMFNVDFIVINGMTLAEYRDLKYVMMKSIMTEGTQSQIWW